MPLNPQLRYVHLAQDGSAHQLPGGEAFWRLPEAEMARYGQGWLISEFEFTADWPNWEMHPEADEFVYLLAGAVEMLLEQRDGSVSRLALSGSAAVLVPRGLWHTAKLLSGPARMLHVTRGAGTQHRPV